MLEHQIFRKLVRDTFESTTPTESVTNSESTSVDMDAQSRRPIASRQTQWAHRIAKSLAQRGIHPNTISLLSVIFAAIAGTCLIGTLFFETLIVRCLLLVGSILGIQLRLLCNLFDGMVAIEQEQKTPSGAVFNDLPDRFSDSIILIGAGYAASGFPLGVELGWLACVLALITAYSRVLGGACGVEQTFTGPMAKQHRMAVTTACSVLSAVLCAYEIQSQIFAAGLAVIVVGCLSTIVRRTRTVIQELETA